MDDIDAAIASHVPVVSMTKHQATQFIIRRAGLAGACNTQKEALEAVTAADCLHRDIFAATCSDFASCYQKFYERKDFDQLRVWAPNIPFTATNDPAPVMDCLDESAIDEEGSNILAQHDDESPHVSLVAGLHFFVTKPSPKLVTARVNTSIIAMCRSNPYPVGNIPVVKNNWIYKQNVALLCSQQLTYPGFPTATIEQSIATVAERFGNAALKKFLEEELQSELPCPGKPGKGVARLPESFSANSAEGPVVLTVTCDLAQSDESQGCIDLRPIQTYQVEQPKNNQEKVIKFGHFQMRDHVKSFLDILS